MDCEKTKSVWNVSLALPFNNLAKFACGTRQNRDSGLEYLLPFLDEAPALKFGATEFSPAGNALHVKYDQKQEIVIAIQAYDHDSETIIRIQPSRVRVSAKYDIHNGRLSEDEERPCTGGTQQTAPKADIYALLKLETLSEIYMRLTVNGTPYLLFWREKQCGQHVRKPVAVVSENTFHAMMEFTRRPVIVSWTEYFRGSASKEEPKKEERQPVEKPEPTDDDSRGEPAATSNDSDSNTSVTPSEAEKIAKAAVEELNFEQSVPGYKYPEAPDANVLTRYGFQRYFEKSARAESRHNETAAIAQGADLNKCPFNWADDE